MADRRRRRPDDGANAIRRFIAYYRVSTEKQGTSGLGLEAQRIAVSAYISRESGTLVAEFEEVETGKRADRPRLAAALAAARASGAILIVAKLDRLARNTRFLLTVAEGAGDGGVVFADLPQIPSGAIGKFFVTLLAAVAELEAGLISQRTKAALAAAKERGVRLGNPGLRSATSAAASRGREAIARRSRAQAADVAPYIRAAQDAGAKSLRDIARALTARGIQTPFGGSVWGPEQVRRVLASIGDGRVIRGASPATHNMHAAHADRPERAI